MPVPGCLCLGRPREHEVQTLDYCHSSLDVIPTDVFTHERTLEELLVDANQIKELPRELFYCHGLRKLTVADNEITLLPPALGTLANLEHLNFSKNGVIEIPDNIKGCKYLQVVEASVNPLGKLTEGFTQLLSLTELYLNDTFLDFLPGSFGRLSKLRILELRENHLKTLPRSFTKLTQIERLDIGNNEFTELPDVVGGLTNLMELWCDTNQIKAIPSVVGNLKQLMFLDASKNRVEFIAEQISECHTLADLHLSNNLLQHLPESLGRLSNLTSLKVDDNRLTSLPFSLGGLVSLSELNVGANDLEDLPPSIGLLRHLRTLYADENYLNEIPCELGSCSGLTVLSLRGNNLMYVPDELGRIPRLRVLNLSDNKIRSLPFSLTKLKQLQALWLAENQTKPLIKLQSDVDPDTGKRVLTCYLLPQQPADDKDADLYSDTDSFHPSLWEEERSQRKQIHFEFVDQPDDEQVRLQRTPTPYPKEMKQHITHIRNLAMKQLGNTVPSGPSEPRPPRQEDPERPPDAVIGRRDSPKKIGSRECRTVEVDLNENLRKPLSPSQTERYLILRADKEKMLKDKARMQRSDGAVDTNDDGGFLDSGSLGRRGQHAQIAQSWTATAMPERQQHASVPSIPQLADNSYWDFLRGLQAQGVAIPPEAWMAPHPSRRQRSSEHSHRPSRRRGYDSDTGHRSDRTHRSERRSGYTSDTGFQRPVSARYYNEAPRHSDLRVHDITQRKSYMPSIEDHTRSLDSSRPVRMETDRLSLVSERSIQEAIQEEKEANSEDEQWKTQLYQASVKLQKSPSDKIPQGDSSSPFLLSKALIRMTSHDAIESELSTAPLPDCIPTHCSPGSRQTLTRSPVRPTPASPSRPMSAQELHKSFDSLHLRSPRREAPSPLPSPLRLPAYEEETFKREPHSQVSSSTDSGYGHNHLIDSSRSFSVHEVPSPHHTDLPLSSPRQSLGSPSRQSQYSSQNQWSPGSNVSASSFQVSLRKSTGLGFSIAGGLSSSGNPFKPGDSGIFITKVQSDGPASQTLLPGDKLLEVDGVDFRLIEHRSAVAVLRSSGRNVDLLVQRLDSSDSSDELITHQV